MSSQSSSKNALGNGPRAASKMDLSGRERDKMFLSNAAKTFTDISYLSGADGVEDARAFAHADLDRDGYEDLIVVNRNLPLLRVYKNVLGPATKNHFVAVRVEGAKAPDAVGARVTATGCGVTQTREVQIGAGFATQNARALTLGLGTCTKLDTLTVKFPNGGQTRAFKDVKADAMYRVVEGKGIQPIQIARAGSPATAPAGDHAPSSKLAQVARSAPGDRPLVLVDVFASWCEACVRTAPRLDALTSSLVDQLDAITVSIEPKDDAVTLVQYKQDHSVPRAMIAYDAALTDELNALFGGSPPLPSTLVVDRKTGAIVLLTKGVPTRSELERAVSIHR